MATIARIIPALAGAICSGALLIGCGGPTKAGLEARSEARDRMGLVNAQISYDQASRAFEVGQFDRALRDITAAIDRFPNAAQFHLLQGRIFLETHRLERALRAFDTAVELTGESREVASRRGTEPASHAETLAKAHYFSGIVFQRWSNHEQAHERYMKAAGLQESNAQYLLAAAESKIALGEYDTARELIEPRLAYFEHNAALRHLLGHIALLQGEPEFAARLFSQARLLNPDDEMLLEELAWAQYAAGLYAQCHDTIGQLHRMSTVRRADLMHLEARCLLFLERNREARDLYMELSRIAPADPEVWIELGALAWELGDMRRVAEAATRVIALAPNRYEGYALRAIYSNERGQFTDADRFLRQAIDRAPGSGDERGTALPHLLLGLVLEQQGRHEQALEMYGYALGISPDSREAKWLYSNSKAGLPRLSTVPMNE